MNPTARFCPGCGAPPGPGTAQFCTACGAPLASTTPLVSVPDNPAPGAAPPEQRAFSAGLITTTRLLSALCMFSAVFAILRFDADTSTGRGVAAASVVVSLSGQAFVLQASKPHPAAWASAVLAVFWVGLVGLTIVWMGLLQ